MTGSITSNNVDTASVYHAAHRWEDPDYRDPSLICWKSRRSNGYFLSLGYMYDMEIKGGGSIVLGLGCVVRRLYRSHDTPSLVTQVIDNVTNLRSSCPNFINLKGSPYLVMLPIIIINLDLHVLT